MIGVGDWGLGVQGPPDDGVAEPASLYSARTVRSFRDLDVWQDAMTLAELAYRETESFPQRETYGMTSQLRRASVSVASNIAEGWGRSSRKDYVRFLYIARGSLFEVATQTEIAKRVGLLTAKAAGRMEQQGATCGRRLNRLIAALSRPHPPTPKP